MIVIIPRSDNVNLDQIARWEWGWVTIPDEELEKQSKKCLICDAIKFEYKSLKRRLNGDKHEEQTDAKAV